MKLKKSVSFCALFLAFSMIFCVSCSSISSEPDETETMQGVFSSTAAGETAETPDVRETENETQQIYDSQPWAAKFADKFSETVVITENSYTSPNISLTISEERNSSDTCTYYVADIYIASPECLQRYIIEDDLTTTRNSISALQALENSGAIFATNGDCYGNTSLMSLVVVNGEVQNDKTSGFSNQDVLIMFNDGSMQTYAGSSFDYESVKDTVYQGWAFGPSLLDSSQQALSSFSSFTSKIEGRNPRTAIGYYEPGHYCLVCVDGRTSSSSGMTMQELAITMQNLGCTLAYNLDGGQSSNMAFNGEYVNNITRRGKSDFIVLIEPG